MLPDEYTYTNTATSEYYWHLVSTPEYYCDDCRVVAVAVVRRGRSCSESIHREYPLARASDQPFRIGFVIDCWWRRRPISCPPLPEAHSPRLPFYRSLRDYTIAPRPIRYSFGNPASPVSVFIDQQLDRLHSFINAAHASEFADHQSRIVYLEYNDDTSSDDGSSISP